MRVTDWQPKLYAYLQGAREKEFEWGTNDCGTFALGAVNAILATPLSLQPNWATKEGADLVLSTNQGLEAIVVEHLGPPVNWGQCGAGDVVLAEWGRGPGLCVHDGVQLLAPSHEGLRRIPFKLALVGWRVN